ncbi:MAG: AEC family transporter [Burkholderiaceae bacterium]|nr:AEC family transporter [Burkholderiaceae bacterium]
MAELLQITGPLFALIGLGWLSVQRGWFDRALLPALGRFVIAFCVPALLWRSLAQRNPLEVLHGGFLLAYALGSLIALGLGWAWARGRGQSVDRAAMTGMGMSCSNTAFIGFPLVSQLVAGEATVAFALVLLVENFLMLPLCLALADMRSGQHEPLHRVLLRSLWGLRRNPIVLGLLAGVATGALKAGTGWTLPSAIDRSVALLAAASTAVSLFFIGGNLAGLHIGGLKTQVAAVAVGKLLLHPLAVALMLGLVGWATQPVAVPLVWGGVVMAAVPMLGIYPILGQRYGLQAVNAACMLGSTVAAFFSLSLVMALLRWAWGAPQ